MRSGFAISRGDGAVPRRTRSGVLRARLGFTLIETLVSLTLLGVLITLTLRALDDQVRLFREGTTTADALQNARYAMSVFEKDLATVGTNVGPEQPFLVYADTHVVVFNADYISDVWNDLFAVYVDTAASNLIAGAVTPARRFQVPRTAFSYPDTTYRMGAQNSTAETITFYFEPDTSTARTDDYQLMRKVNDQPSDPIAQGILRIPNTPFFEYVRRITPPSAAPFLQSAPLASLPLRHTARLHGSPADTGRVSAIDSVRAVRVAFRVTDNRPGALQRTYNTARTIWFPNAGMAVRQTCGDEPITGNLNFLAAPVVIDGSAGVELTWSAATDETSGENDVIRYIIYRSDAPGPVTDPYLSIPAGNTNYTYTDFNVEPGITYYYSIAAQDCTPRLSDPNSAPPVIVP